MEKLTRKSSVNWKLIPSNTRITLIISNAQCMTSREALCASVRLYYCRILEMDPQGKQVIMIAIDNKKWYCFNFDQSEGSVPTKTVDKDSDKAAL